MGDSVDFLGFLPLEIVDVIVSQLDLETLVNCTLVCKRWNSVISSSPQVWKAACEELGLRVKKSEEIVEYSVDYRTIFLRMRKRLQKFQDGGKYTQIDTIDPTKICIYPCTAYCMYYHNGVLGIGNKQNSIELWKLEPHLELLLKIDTSSFPQPNCIKFDDSFLVSGASTGQLITWELPTAKVLLTQVQHPGGVTLVAFSKEIDLLVSASFFSVIFWSLSSGQILLPEYSIHRRWDCSMLINIHLISTPGQPNGCDYMLVCNCRSSFQALGFNSKNIRYTLNCVLLHDIDVKYYPSHLSIPSSHVVNSFLYFMCSSPDSHSSTFYKCDIFSGNIEFEIEIFDCYENLVGVGEKYAFILEWSAEEYTQNMVIFDICTETELAKLPIPKCPDAFNVYNMKVILGDKRWLDGFDGFNDKGAILVSEDTNGITNVVKWLP